ncbi:MAG: MotA/TolQ/ExbB proton channel family protein, partial [Verrucomicrobia bacterium]|nr:MotA/TolQ/ExbB proton channel family protein [Verrucomicrobiota bacterium]
MTVSFYIFAAMGGAESELGYIWRNATVEGKSVIVLLVVLSVFAWAVMASKALQMRQAKKYNRLFDAEFRSQSCVMGIFDRRVQVDGCPLFSVYQEGCVELDSRLNSPDGNGRKRHVSLKAMEHIKRTLEGAVARESLKLERGLITLALAVSGGPFLGLLGTVWGVMSTFSHVGMAGKADLPTMA